MSKDAVILFSGGTDSTLTAAKLVGEFDRIHLITYNRFGFHSTDNVELQVNLLRSKYGAEKFISKIINVDKLFKHISYENYFKNIKEFGLFNLSTCGLCKLSMHVRTVVYCVDNNISYVADGANQAMSMFPTQMKEVIDDLKSMYELYGITYFNPVFDMMGPNEIGFEEKMNLQISNDYTVPEIEKVNQCSHHKKEEKDITPGQALFDLGLAPSQNVKGSKYDRKRQPRCFQFIIFNIFAIKYFLHDRTYEEYKEVTVRFYKKKISRVHNLISSRDKFKKLFD